MRVLFFCSWYPSRVFPTNGDFIQRHAEAVALWHEVVVVHVVTDPALAGGRMEVTEQRRGALRELIAYLPPQRALGKWFAFRAAYRKLAGLAGACELVHVHHVYPALVFGAAYARRRGLPLFVSEHWTGFLTGAWRRWNPVMKALLHRASRQVSCFCPVTEHLGRAMQAAGFRGRYEPVPNVVDTDLFRPRAGEREPGPFRLLHISSMKDGHKNVRGLLRALAGLQTHARAWELYLIGDRPERYRTYARELGMEEGRLHYVDNLPQGDLVPYMQQADLLLMFSRFENLPCVILEAFACGLPVVSTEVGGIAEYFPPDFGRLIPSEDEERLREEVRACLEGRRSWAPAEKMHAYAVEHFSRDRIGARFGEVYCGGGSLPFAVYRLP